MPKNLKLNFSNEWKFASELITNEKFLNGDLSSLNYHIISIVDDAVGLYTDQEPNDINFDSYPDLLSEREYAAYLYGELSKEEETKYAKPLWRDYELKLWDLINLQAKKKKHFSDDFLDFIYNDFLTFAAYHIFSDEQDEFINRQIEVYQNGGFPCGWKGKYPQGEIVVYSPRRVNTIKANK